MGLLWNLSWLVLNKACSALLVVFVSYCLVFNAQVPICEANVFQTVSRTVVNLGLARSFFEIPLLKRERLDGNEDVTLLEKHDRSRKSANIIPTITQKPAINMMSIGNALLVVNTSHGFVMGRRENEGFKIPVKAFKGIPYAAPPVGDLRFRDPKESPPWQNIKMAVDYRSGCLSYAFGFAVGDEDCLYLNVFVPEMGENQGNGNVGGLPVAVWIQGGTPAFGWHFVPVIYHPKTFTDQGVIFISINYRMGVLGFLSNGDRDLPGNYGMKDIVMALEWVKQNIRNFGGDPQLVNLIGHGDGAKAVHALVLSPMAKGLFKTGVLMSGTSLMLQPHAKKNNTSAKSVARFLKCPQDDSVKIVECLKQRGANELTKAQLAIEESPDQDGLGIVIDDSALDPFMPEHPLAILREQQATSKQIPLMVGTVGKELIHQPLGLLSNKAFFERLTSDWDNQCEKFVNYSAEDGMLARIDLLADEKRELCRRVRQIYFKDGIIEASTADETLIHIYTEMATLLPAYTTAMLHAKHTNAPVFYYSFEHSNDGRVRIADVLHFLQSNRLLPHVSNFTSDREVRFANEPAHSDDLFLLFDPEGSAYYRSNQLSFGDEIAKQSLVSGFTSFWRTKGSSPNVPGLSNWKQFNPDEQEYLKVLSKGPKMSTRLVSVEKLRIFADWHDFYHRLSQRGSASSPSLSEMLFEDDAVQERSIDNNTKPTTFARITRRLDDEDEDSRIQRHNLTLLQFLQRLKKMSSNQSV